MLLVFVVSGPFVVSGSFVVGPFVVTGPFVVSGPCVVGTFCKSVMWLFEAVDERDKKNLKPLRV